MTESKKFWILAIPIFFLVPSLVYWAIVTHFHFNLFSPDWLWTAYNQYFLSLLGGRFDVPVEAIGPEGLVYKDKTYMYYGILPAILRGIIYPFVDLETTPVSRLFVLIWLLGAVGVLQWILIKYFLRKEINSYRFSTLLLTSFVFWFGSVYFSIIQNASIYQEPYAASLFLMSLFMALFSQDVLFKEEVDVLHLKSYALLAALSVHARPNIAIFLYAITLVIIFFDCYQQSKKTTVNHARCSNLVNWLIKRALLPMVIMGLGGAFLLLMNYLKYDDPFSLAKGSYGYYLLEGASLKFQGLAETGQFNLIRIFPHAIYYFTGDFQLLKSLSNSLGLGYVSVGVPETRLIVAWAIPVIAFVSIIVFLLKNISTLKAKNVLTGLVFILSVLSTFMMFSYGTIAYRYAADLWMPFLLSMLWLYQFVLGCEKRIKVFTSGVVKAPITAMLLFISAVSPLYTMSNYEQAYFSETRRAGVYSNYEGEVFLPHKKHIEVMKRKADQWK